MRKATILAVLILATIGNGQYWEIEQVDTAPWGGGLRIRGHLGLTLLGYCSGTGLRIASRDSIWRRLDVPTRYAPLDRVSDFDVGPTGQMGMTYLGEPGMRLVEWGDTMWVESAVPVRGYHNLPRLLAYDSAGRPGVLGSQNTGADEEVLVYVWRHASTWQAETVDCCGFESYFSAADLYGWRAPRTTTLQVYHFQMDSVDLQYDDLRSSVRVDTGWQVTSLWVVRAVLSVAGAVDSSGRMHFCCEFWDPELPDEHGFQSDGELIDTLGTISCAFVLDDAGRPMIARGRPDGIWFQYRDQGQWRSYQVSSESAHAVQLLVRPDSQPVVAFATEDGVFAAFGVDILGQEEPEAEPHVAELLHPTIMRAPELAKLDCRVLDITGRDVTEGKEVLRPGVYFLLRIAADQRQLSGSPVLREPHYVRKVVLTE